MDSQNRFAQNTDNHRLPTALEKQEGFPCGPLDRELFNKLFNSLQAEIGAVVTDAGLTSTDVTDTWLRDSIRQLISNGRDDFVIWIDASVTYTIGPGGDYPDIRAVMSYLSDFLIADGVTVTLQFTAGVHTYTEDIICNHPMGKNIRIIGSDLLSTAPVFADFVATGNTTAARTADGAANIAMLRSKYATELRLNGCSMYCYGGIARIDRLLLVGDNSSGKSGLVLSQGTFSLGNVATHAFAGNGIIATSTRTILYADISATNSGLIGIAINDSYISNEDFFVGDPHGIYCFGNSSQGLSLSLGSSLFNLKVHCHGNVLSGFSVSRNASAELTKTIASTASKNGAHGLLAVSARADCEFFQSTENGSIGIVSTAGSYINAPSSTVTGNVAIGFYAADGSYIQSVGSYVTSNPTNHSPAPNTVGNHHSYVRTI